MDPNFGWLSILPPAIAIALSLRTRQVHLSLFAGICAGTTILAAFNPVAGFMGGLEQVADVVGYLLSLRGNR